LGLEICVERNKTVLINDPIWVDVDKLKIHYLIFSKNKSKHLSFYVSKDFGVACKLTCWKSMESHEPCGLETQ
jgi:hypothetical protein